MLEKLVEGDLPPVILVDFAMFSTADTMTGLVGVPESRWETYRIDAVQDLEIHGSLTIARLADLYAKEIEGLGSRPAAVLGYCSAATLALALAKRLASGGDGHAPAVVLVEPTWLSVTMIGQELDALRATLGATGDRPAELTLDTVLATLTGDLTTKLAADGMPEAEIETCVTMLTQRYEAWFGFLFATVDAAVPTPEAPVSLVVSGDSDRGPAPGWTAAQCSSVRVDVPPGEFLRSPVVRQKIFDLIDRA